MVRVFVVMARVSVVMVWVCGHCLNLGSHGLSVRNYDVSVCVCTPSLRWFECPQSWFELSMFDLFSDFIFGLFLDWRRTS